MGCRKTKDKSELIRIVKTPLNSIEIDLNMKLPGRGVYICPEKDCVKKTLQKKVLSSAFKEEIDTPEVNEFFERLKKRLEDKIVSLIGISYKSGRVSSGRTQVKEEMIKNNICLIIFTEDASTDLSDKIKKYCDQKKIRYYWFSLKQNVSKALAGKERAVLGIKDMRLAKTIEKNIETLNNITVA